MIARLLCSLAAVAGCKSEPATVAPTTCARIDLALASAIVADAAHPCRARVDAAYGRMMAHGRPFSGTLVSTTPTRGGGLFVTCQHCTGAGCSPAATPTRPRSPMTRRSNSSSPRAPHRA